eukprot:g13331.t1
MTSMHGLRSQASLASKAIEVLEAEKAVLAKGLRELQRQGSSHEWRLPRWQQRLEYLSMDSKDAKGVYIDSADFELSPGLGPYALRFYPRGVAGGDGLCAVGVFAAKHGGRSVDQIGSNTDFHPTCICSPLCWNSTPGSSPSLCPPCRIASVEMVLRLRPQKWPKWARRALAPLVAKSKASKMDLEAFDSETSAANYTRVLSYEAQHMAADGEDVPLTSPRDLEAEEGAEGADEERAGGEALDDAQNFRELMAYSAQDKKAENFMPIAGNMYRIQNMGMFMIFAAQLLAPPACIVNNLYRMDWSHWAFGVSDWMYIHGSKDHGISNLSKHIESIASMKITAMLLKIEQDRPEYLQDVKWGWLIMGRLMNCMVVIECCVIVYFSFVLSDTPMDVLFNSMAVTFLYNLDDIDGEMGFLTDEDWDGDELGKLYYQAVAESAFRIALTTEDSIEKCPPMRNKYNHWTYKVATPVVYVMTILLPLMYIFIDDLHCKPYGVKETVIELKAQVEDLVAQIKDLQ